MPLEFIVADAEASAITEIMTLMTNGSNCSMIGFFRNSTQISNLFMGCNTNTVTISDTCGNAPALGQNPVLRTGSSAAGSLSIDVEMDHSATTGQMGLAFGILEAVDRGILPSSYGFAQHQIQYTFADICNNLSPLPSATKTITTGLINGSRSLSRS